MATDTRTGGATTTPDPTNLRPELTAALAQGDATAAERVQHLQWVQQARVSRLSRTAAEMTAEYGADDDGTRRAEAALATARAATTRLAVLHQQITTADPDVPAGGWVLHGRVFGHDMKPMRGFTVFLVDSAKAYQNTYGFAYTDETGYFLLKHAPGRETSKGTAAAAQAAGPTELFLEVAGLDARPVYLSASPFVPVAGTVDYQNIVLSKRTQPLGQPPGKPRKAAPTKRKPKT